MRQKSEIDMLHGPVLGKIILFALPITVSGLLQQAFNAADTAVVGHFAGSDSLAAVGANSFVIGLMINLFLGLAVGQDDGAVAARPPGPLQHQPAEAAPAAAVGGR